MGRHNPVFRAGQARKGGPYEGHSLQMQSGKRKLEGHGQSSGRRNIKNQTQRQNIQTERQREREREEDGRLIGTGAQSRKEVKKQESSTANGNESCIKCSAEGDSSLAVRRGRLFRLGRPTGGFRQNAARLKRGWCI